jgi:hypothetical protein
MTMSEEEECLQQLNRAIDDQGTTTDWSLMMETISTST